MFLLALANSVGCITSPFAFLPEDDSIKHGGYLLYMPVRISSSVVDIALGAAIALFGCFSVVIGQDVNFDLRNYHFYNAYAFLNNREEIDLLPGQLLQSFHNPLLDIPLYLLIANSPPRLASFALGAIQGINALLVFCLARRVLGTNGKPAPRLLALLATAIGAASPVFLSELGTTFGDNLTSIPILAGLLLLCSVEARRRLSWTDLMAGIAIGLATGLKLTNSPYAVAALAAILATTPLHMGWKRAVAFGLGLALGLLTTGGWWMIHLAVAYGNPIFPYYNAIFQSPYAQSVNWRDQRWVPDGILAILCYPFAWAMAEHPLPSSEKDFRDPRWMIILVSGALYLLVLTIQRIRSAGAADVPRSCSHRALADYRVSAPARFVLIYSVFAYLVWFFQFGYSRYLIPLDLITGIILWILLLRLPLSSRFVYNVGFCLSLWAILSGLKVPSWGRAPWTSTWFDVRIQSNADFEQAMILMISDAPLSYLVPFFNPGSRFIRINGSAWDMNTGAFQRRAAEAIDAHSGKLFALTSSAEDVAQSRDLLARYGLANGDLSTCIAVTSKIDTARICPLLRVATRSF